MSKPVTRTADAASSWTTFSTVPAEERSAVLSACREVTDAIYEGLDVYLEIRSVADQRLGDTVLLQGGDRFAGLAVCHSGPGTEAGSGTCYIKFAAVRPGAAAREDFDRLLSACERFAVDAGARRLTAGVSTARHEAYTRMLERGFRTDMQGVAMKRPNEAGYNRAGVYVLDDLR
jgi:hypothetical protein